MKKIIKSHRYTLILILFFALIVLIGFKVKQILVPDEGKATYGERLRDIEKHPIDDEVYTKIDEAYANNDKIKKITHRIQGKIIVYSFTFEDSVVAKDAKAEAEKLVSLFDKELLDYYSLEVYLIKEEKQEEVKEETKEEEKEEKVDPFPIIGMKNPLSEKISWTKDR